MTYDPAGVRIDRFVEGIAVIKGVMGPGPFSFAGEHYTITDYDGLPKPVQAPCPPILIGGGGKRVLSIAAREADIVGVNGSLHAGVIGAEAIATMTEEAVVDKVAIVADAARAAGPARRRSSCTSGRSSSASPTTASRPSPTWRALAGLEPAMRSRRHRSRSSAAPPRSPTT